MGTTIYISSTFNDLEEYREAVYRALRKMQQEVVAMEDYVARDERPLDRCLADVERSDLYVGIFAWRYGFIPKENNPDGRSITELEYRHAGEKGVPRLIFLLAEDEPWRPALQDSHTREGDAGTRIATLRAELSDQHSVEFFTNSDHLASLVQGAVSVHLDEARETTAGGDEEPALLHPREIRYPWLVAYAETDQVLVERLLAARSRGGVRVIPEALLFASDTEAFERLEREARRAERASVVLSSRVLQRFRENPAGCSRVLGLLRARTSRLEAFCDGPESAGRAGELFAFDATHDLSALSADELGRLLSDEPAATGRAIGLPYVVVAMTRAEADQLAEHPELIEIALGAEASERFASLRDALAEQGQASLATHYGDERELWRPFSADPDEPGPATLLDEVVGRLNEARRPELRGRRLEPQLYPFDALVSEDELLRPIYAGLAEEGCLAIVDELSLCHPRISRAAAQLFGHRSVAIVTVSPLDPRSPPLYQLLERELSRSLGFAFDRFDRDLDPHCEVGVGSARHLKRWLFSCLPSTAARLFEPEPDRASLRRFARELDIEDHGGLATELYSEGGGL